MSKPVDLDELMRLHGETVQGEWKACRACTGRGAGCRIVWAPDGNHTIFESGDAVEVPTTGTPADAAFVVAAHNSLPALAAELRARRARDESTAKLLRDALESLVALRQGYVAYLEIAIENGEVDEVNECEGDEETISTADARIDAIEQVLAKVPR
jgi:hypothetical protein